MPLAGDARLVRKPRAGNPAARAPASPRRAARVLGGSRAGCASQAVPREERVDVEARRGDVVRLRLEGVARRHADAGRLAACLLCTKQVDEEVRDHRRRQQDVAAGRRRGRHRERRERRCRLQRMQSGRDALLDPESDGRRDVGQRVVAEPLAACVRALPAVAAVLGLLVYWNRRR